MRITKFIFSNIIIPLVMGALLANQLGRTCILTCLPVVLPCWAWNMILISVPVAMILDYFTYVLPKILLPKTKRFRKWSTRLINQFTRPKFKYTSEVDNNGFLYLNIKSHFLNKPSRLTLYFNRLMLISGTAEERGRIDYESINAKGKVIFSENTKGKDVFRHPIFEKAKDGKIYLFIPDNYYLIPLFPGKSHIIEFHEVSAQNGRVFDMELRKVEFLYPRKNTTDDN